MYKVTIVDLDDNKVLLEKDNITVIAASFAYDEKSNYDAAATVLTSVAPVKTLISTLKGLDDCIKEIKKEYPEEYLLYSLFGSLLKSKEGGKNEN